MKLSQLPIAALRLLGTFCMSRPVLAIGTVKSGINTTNPILAVIDGIVKNVAALTSQALVTLSNAFYVQPAGTTVYYVFVTDGTNIRTIQGTYQGQPLVINGINLVGDGTVPDVPDLSVASTSPGGVQTLAQQWAPFGFAKVTTVGVTFTPGTTLFDAAGVTTTFYDCAFLPAADRP